MKFIILASTPLGCLWASILAKSDTNQVVLVHFRRSFVELIKRQRGMLVRVEKRKGNELVNLEAFTTFQEAFEFLGNEVECVLVMVKVFTTAKIFKFLSRDTIQALVDQKTMFCTLYNALPNAEHLATFIPRPQIMFGITVAHAVMTGDASIEGTHNRPSNVWVLSNLVDSEHRRVVKCFNSCQLPTTISRDAELMLWKKLAVNCAINCVTTMCQLKIGSAATEAGAIGHYVMMDIATEVSKVAQAEGVTLSEKEAIDSLGFVLQKAAQHVSSMCNEVLNRRQTEIENLNGFVIRCAKKHHVATPLVTTYYRMVKLLEDTYHLQLRPAVASAAPDGMGGSSLAAASAADSAGGRRM